MARKGKESFIQRFDGDVWWKETRGRLRRKWENNIKIAFPRTAMGVLGWIDLTEDRESDGLL